MKDIPLVVDLDGTLIYTDILYESLFKFIKNAPFKCYQLFLKLLKGKVALKKFLSEHHDLDVSLLPYNQELITWLKSQKEAGRKLILCTASFNSYAQKIAEHLGIFDEVMASHNLTNLKGKEKSKLLNDRFGVGHYQYVGNSRDDIHVWKYTQDAVLVNSKKNLVKKVNQYTNVELKFNQKVNSLKVWFKVIRCYQWLKNILIFIPLFAAHHFGNVQKLFQTTLAFIAFSLCASSVYILNDLLDVESDRKHPRKKNRPFASGQLSPQKGLVLMSILLMFSLIISSFVSLEFSLVLLGYYALTSFYSFKLKQIILLDCMTLALLYNFRILAGAICTHIPLSYWLIAFSMFFFYSLALVKRYAEIGLLSALSMANQFGRDYHLSDQNFIQILGVSSGLSAIVIFGLYLNSPNVQVLYKSPLMLGMAIPLMLYWISWIWMKANRGQMHDDPLVFACKEKISLSIAALLILIFILATKI